MHCRRRIFLLVSKNVISKSFYQTVVITYYHVKKLFWGNALKTSTTVINEAMSRNIYNGVKRYLHLNCILARSNYKIHPIFEIFNIALHKIKVFSENLTIGEIMVRYFGMHSYKTCKKNKPVKCGYKL